MRVRGACIWDPTLGGTEAVVWLWMRLPREATQSEKTEGPGLCWEPGERGGPGPAF